MSESLARAHGDERKIERKTINVVVGSAGGGDCITN
jgi:hypothetical protein